MLPGFADEHVNRRIVQGLQRRGMDVVTAQERGRRSTDDALLLAEAAREGRLMLTNDTDFLRLHHDWMNTGQDHAGIVFWSMELPIGQAVLRIFDFATRTDPAAAVNHLEYL